ncbi:unnamed protein product [Rotaria socialis]|uniref:Uncharacterized protein n=1 Tax=Rotaria socialis TaxID=392032 RepID=A0A818GS43_9BILA|nr:unnamed protein product [Rotaria socialis]
MLLSKKCFYIDSLRISDPIFDSFYFLFNNQGDSNGARWSSWKPLIYIVRVIFQSIVVKYFIIFSNKWTSFLAVFGINHTFFDH